jgi:hypothetical protein
MVKLRKIGCETHGGSEKVTPLDARADTEGRRRCIFNPLATREVKNDNRIFIDNLRGIKHFRFLEVHDFLIKCCRL